MHLVGFYCKNISRCTVLWMSNSWKVIHRLHICDVETDTDTERLWFYLITFVSKLFTELQLQLGVTTKVLIELVHLQCRLHMPEERLRFLKNWAPVNRTERFNSCLTNKVMCLHYKAQFMLFRNIHAVYADSRTKCLNTPWLKWRESTC